LTLHEKKDSRPLFERAGAWLFRQRSSLPVPLALALLFIPAAELSSLAAVWLGAGFVVCGEALRLWAVRHIGVISRTRGDRLGPLVETGPFALIRNPLYVGNLALWVGFTLSARLVWLVPVVIIILGLEYHAIVRWEESLLESRRGDQYRAYASRVPRWIPRVGSPPSRPAPRPPLPPPERAEAGRPSSAVSQARDRFTWRETLFSERGTLIAIAAGYLLLWIKAGF
jgi:protein-S-isoprenylcysteine O-methyltransferase Ste14